MKITVLVDNNESKGWHSEHGLALLLEHLDGYLLFDTGAGKATPFNLIKAGFRPELLKMIVLSHGHYDLASRRKNGNILWSGYYENTFQSPSGNAGQKSDNAGILHCRVTQPAVKSGSLD